MDSVSGTQWPPQTIIISTCAMKIWQAKFSQGQRTSDDDEEEEETAAAAEKKTEQK